MLSNSHNFVSPPNDSKKRFGIRVTLAATDPFSKFVADGWEKFHWFDNAEKRDAVMADMLRRHEYSRLGDLPTIRCEPVER